ncbi:MAG: baseplate J/gp47 family protein [Devosia sp.]
MSDRRDLTRWNRAGLKRFDYVDGNAAAWLEELRLAMLARFARGAAPEARTEDYWRKLPTRKLTPGEAEAARQAVAHLTWSSLFADLPARPEGRRSRNERLLASYHAPSTDQAQQIMRAFSRAAHVLLGHVDAYANEGYLRTATQWDSMRKLAAMIGYQPAAGASAATVVGLVIDTAVEGAVEVERGVPMSFTPPGGGKPVLLETVETIMAHRELNAARALGFDHNDDLFATGAGQSYRVPKGTLLRSGDIAVLHSDITALRPDLVAQRPELAQQLPWPTTIADVSMQGDDIATVDLADRAPVARWVCHGASLLSRPEKVLRARPRTSGAGVVVTTSAPGLLHMGAIFTYIDTAGQRQLARVKAVDGTRIELDSAPNLPPNAQLTLATRYGVRNGVASTSTDVNQIFFVAGNTLAGVPLSNSVVSATSGLSGISTHNGATGGTPIAHHFARPAGARDEAYATVGTTAAITVTLLGDPPPVAADGAGTERTIEFPGKPSPATMAGAWFVARNGTELSALEVEAVRSGPDSHFILFRQELGGAATDYEFHGPMLLRAPLLDHDRGQNPVFDGGITLTGISAATQKLIKTGRKVIAENTYSGVAQLLTIAQVERNANWVRIGVDENPDLLDGWVSGWTHFRLNTTRATHGETRGAKALGSGSAEFRRQRFHLGVKEVSFIPSGVAESGVAPDLDVTVQEVMWAYRDLSDPTAEDTDSWSVRVLEDETLEIVFRRRLPTGTNNIAVRRHRVGMGPAGNGVPAFAFSKPSKKHRHVVAISQPFAPAGGAEREPVESMREAAPARLAANGRAVSLRDFEKLASRHAGVWQARATQLAEVGAAVRVVVVPAYGSPVHGAFADQLASHIRDRAIPGARIEIAGFVPKLVLINAGIRVDTARYDKNDVIEAATLALAETFGLRQRRLGQALLIGEVLAALEGVEGVESAVATLFAERSFRVRRQQDRQFAAGPSQFPSQATQAENRVGSQSITAAPNEVAHVQGPSAVTITAESI